MRGAEIGKTNFFKRSKYRFPLTVELRGAVLGIQSNQNIGGENEDYSSQSTQKDESQQNVCVHAHKDRTRSFEGENSQPVSRGSPFCRKPASQELPQANV
jgi:hypothetical protein